MPEARHLSNAPIVEALIDIRVELPGSVECAHLEPFYERVKTDYGQRKVRTPFVAQMSLHPEGPSVKTHTANPDGLILTSQNGQQVVQARLDGFTISRLTPYETWHKLRDEAERLWNIYREVAMPVRVVRTAVRYINRFEFDPPMTDLGDYFSTRPEIAEGIPSDMNGFFMRVVLQAAEKHATVIVTQAFEPQAGVDKLPFILDIDVFRAAALAPDDAEVWASLEALRAIKNEVFFNSVREKVLERYQ